jgi:hypothetical protein
MATKSRSNNDQKTRARMTSGSFPLTDEVKTYEANLPGWSDRAGQSVLIKHGDVLGFYSRYEEALKAGYEQLGNEPFLVKHILRHEPIYQVGHIEL